MMPTPLSHSQERQGEWGRPTIVKGQEVGPRKIDYRSLALKEIAVS
jgi:hypothetical protein